MASDPTKIAEEDSHLPIMVVSGYGAILATIGPHDVAGLIALIAARPSEEALATMLSRLARFVGLAVDTAGSVVASEAVAWPTVGIL